MADTIQNLLKLNFSSMNNLDLLKHGKAVRDALCDIHDRLKNAESNNAEIENILLHIQMIENKETSATSDIEKPPSSKTRVLELENENDSAAEQVAAATG